MRKMLVAAALSAIVLPGMAAADQEPALDGEAKLAILVDGLVEREQVSCLATPAMASVVEGTAIVFRRGNKLYVNRPRSGTESLGTDTSLYRKVYGSQLCSGQALELADNVAGTPAGYVRLGDFVPYEQVRTSAR